MCLSHHRTVVLSALMLLMLQGAPHSLEPHTARAAVEADLGTMFLTPDDLGPDLSDLRSFYSRYLDTDDTGANGAYGVEYIRGDDVFHLAANVNSYVMRYEGERQAHSGFEAASDQLLQAGGTPMANVSPIGDESNAILTQETYSLKGDCPTGNYTFRTGLYVGEVQVIDCSQYRPPAPSLQIEPLLTDLGAKLLRHIQGDAVRTTPNLTTRAIRVIYTDDDTSVFDTPPNDRYVRLDGRYLPSYDESPDAQPLNELFYGAASDVYYVSTTFRTPRPFIYRLFLLHFQDEMSASSYLKNSEQVLQQLDRLPVERNDLPAVGDQSVTYEVIRDDMEAEYQQGLQTFIRVGRDVAAVTLYYAGAAPIASLRELTEAQTTCLSTDHCDLFRAIPDEFAS